MAKTLKRRAGAPAAKTGRPAGASVKAASWPARAWPQLLGEATLLVLVVSVPIVINPRSQLLTDVKDVVLGLGALLGICLWLVTGLAQGRLSWVRTPLVPLSLAYLLWAGAGVLYSGRYWSVSIGEVGRLAACVALFLLAVVSLRSLPQVRRVVGAACLASVPVSIYAYAQASGHDFIEWSSRSGAERVFSFLGNPTYLGGFIMLIVPVASAAIWSRVRGRRRDGSLSRPLTIGLLAICAIMMLASLYYSFTLAAGIGLGLGALVILVLLVASGGRRAIRAVLLAALVAGVILAAAGPVAYRAMPAGQRARVQKVIHFQDPFGSERQLHWRTALWLFRQRPVVGYGYGTFRIHSLERMTSEWYKQAQRRSSQMLMPGYAHNEYLQVLADSGLVGGSLFLALLLMFYVTIFRLARHPEAEWRHLALGIAAAVTAFLFQNAVGVTFRQAGASMFFWLWMGVAATGAASLPRREGDLGRDAIAEWRGPNRSVGGVIAAALGATVVFAVIAWVSIAPLIANMRVRLARALAAQGHYQEAIAVCNAALDLCPSSTLAQYVKAFAAGQLGDYQMAVKANEEALKLAPGNASAYYNLGVSYKQLREYPEAEKAFREAIRLMPIKQHFASLAETLFESGRLDAAEQETRRVLAMDAADREEPGNSRVQGLLASIEAARTARAPQAPESVDALRAALQQQPDSVALNAQLTILLIRQKRYREGLPQARRWAQLEPTAAMAQRAIGVCAFSVGEFPTAKQAFQRQVEMEPANMKARLDLASTHAKLRDYDNALAGFQYVAEHGGDSQEAREARRILAKVQPPAQPRSGELSQRRSGLPRRVQ